MILIEATPSERVAYLTYVLASGRTLTSREAADLLAVSPRTARRTLSAVSRVVPIVREEGSGEWRLLTEGGVSISPF